MKLDKKDIGKKDVGAAKGEAAPGPDNNAPMLSMKDKQMKGPKDEPTKATMSASDAGSYEERGLTSEIAKKHWKATGYKIPKTENDDYT